MCLNKVIFIFIQAFIAVYTAYGQLPQTNIYTLDLRANEQKVLLNNLTMLTAFNPEGYNNQPHFINDHELLITSDFDCLGLTDILHCELSNNTITRITKTEESEYSPTVMANGLDFSVIRQEIDESQTTPQVLWSYPINRENGGRQIVPDIQNIGYHLWVTPDKVALYLVSSPSELVLYDTKNSTVTHIANNVGRCLKADKNNNILYIQDHEGVKSLRSFDIYLGRSKSITTPLEGQQDFDLLPNGHLISADSSKLYTLIPGVDKNWKLNKDLSKSGILKISRIASFRGKLAIVTN